MLATTLTKTLSRDEAAEYDAFVHAAPDGGFAQLRDYASLATSERPFSARYFLARDGARLVGAALVLRSRLGRLPLPFAQVERGPVTGDVERLGEVVRALRATLLRRGVLRLSVMPYWSDDVARQAEAVLAREGLAPVDDLAGAHVRTLRMPIGGPSSAAVLSGSRRKTLRYELRLAERAGVTSARARGDDTRAYLELAAAAGAPKPAPFARALADVTRTSERVACFVAREAGAPLAAVLVARTDARLTLLAGVTAPARRPFAKMAPPLVAAIEWARDHGARELDLGGVPRAGDADPKRLAIAAFKRSFSDAEVTLTREHVRWG